MADQVRQNVSPVRFTLTYKSDHVYRVSIPMLDGPIKVREDRITDEDVAKVERYLADFLGDKFQGFDFSDNARALLALVLGEGER